MGMGMVMGMVMGNEGSYPPKAATRPARDHAYTSPKRVRCPAA